MKNWYASISSSNKKRYVLALLEDVRSAWTLSCLLKSIWNCRTKDAIQSSYEKNPWSSYDQIPMDHNRTALPVVTLAQVMKNGRFWFLTLEPQAQAIVLTELLSLSGGPVMRAVLQRAQILYEKYREDQLQNLQECIVVNDTPHEKETHVIPEKGKKEQAVKFTHETTINGKASLPAGRAEKQLEANLAIWNNAIKAMRDSLKLEELEMTFKDGTKRNIWKVNRPNPESIETVTYEQLLRHDLSIDVIDPASRSRNNTYCGVTSITPSSKMRVTLNMSLKASEKSAGAFSFRHLVGPERLTMPVLVMKPIRNLAELSERLERRGAADENIWQWCENILHNHKYRKAKRTAEGVLPSDNKHFPCRIIKETLHVPLNPPLYKDPAVNTEEKLKRNISNATVITMPKKPDAKKRLSLWSRDLSSLYKVYKIPSHASPI
ncbi:uncharacterized protein LOC106142392 [Amyelois transitella]|uniref:uncharacterized protein LOC106142392 n=1 Tax=Amyelois transitella TaxID=680683 RepID=UPI0029903162|nr:uncharacterized protein LOC106142392 [Amyelois transitella]XP_060803059.1 uncharacterized protein LOC106142392 [Amyelois transitella]